MAYNELTRRKTPLQEELELRSGPGYYIPGDQGVDLLKDLPPSEFQPRTMAEVQDYRNVRPIDKAQQRPKEEFRQQVANQALMAQQSFMQGQADRGVVDPMALEKMRQKSFMVGGQVVADNEFKEALKAEENVLNELSRTSGLADEVQMGKFKMQLQERMNGLKLRLVQEAHKFEQQLRGAEKSFQKRMAIYKIAGGVAEQAGYAMAMGYGQPSGQATATKTAQPIPDYSNVPRNEMVAPGGNQYPESQLPMMEEPTTSGFGYESDRVRGVK